MYAQDFFTGWLGALFLQSQRGAVSRAYNTCAKSQVSKWNKHKLFEQLSVQLCSCRVEAVLFQFKFGYGREQRHRCGTLSLKNYQVVLYFYSKWLLSGFFFSQILSGGGCLWTYQQVDVLFLYLVLPYCTISSVFSEASGLCPLGNTNVSG